MPVPPPLSPKRHSPDGQWSGGARQRHALWLRSRRGRGAEGPTGQRPLSRGPPSGLGFRRGAWRAAVQALPQTCSSRLLKFCMCPPSPWPGPASAIPWEAFLPETVCVPLPMAPAGHAQSLWGCEYCTCPVACASCPKGRTSKGNAEERRERLRLHHRCGGAGPSAAPSPCHSAGTVAWRRASVGAGCV